MGFPRVGQKKREIQRQQARKRRYIAAGGAAGAVAAVAIALMLIAPPGGNTNPPPPANAAYAVVHTASGTIVWRFFEKEAPISSANFIGLVQEGYYNGLPWHRVVAGFVIQTGNKASDPRPSIVLEAPAQTGLHNSKGTLGVARTDDPNSGSTQFYINTDDNLELDTTGGGYAVFGIVTMGMENATRVTQGEIISSISFVRSDTPPTG